MANVKGRGLRDYVRKVLRETGGTILPAAGWRWHIGEHAGTCEFDKIATVMVLDTGEDESDGVRPSCCAHPSWGTMPITGRPAARFDQHRAEAMRAHLARQLFLKRQGSVDEMMVSLRRSAGRRLRPRGAVPRRMAVAGRRGRGRGSPTLSFCVWEPETSSTAATRRTCCGGADAATRRNCRRWAPGGRTGRTARRRPPATTSASAVHSSRSSRRPKNLKGTRPRSRCRTASWRRPF